MHLTLTPFGLLTTIAIALFFGGGAQAQAASDKGRLCPVPKLDAADIRLEPDCTYRGMFVLSRPNMTLDCRGALIDASDTPSGIRIRGPKLRNIQVLNCRIDGAKSSGLVVQQPTDDITMAALPKEARYAEGVQGVLVKNVSITRSAAVGLYVDSYAQDVVLDKVSISRSGGAGIYLEHSSVRTSVLNSTIEDNGSGDSLGRRDRGMRREGIAIDSSAYNIVRNTRFSRNAAGGIFLYKNCWEHHTKAATVPRWLHSSHNVIEGNTFKDEKIGVWVASRQSLDMSKWDCGDPALAPGYYRDRADNNKIIGNKFDGGLVGVRVNDDFTTVKNNRFTAPERDCVQLGSLVRDRVVKAPIKGTELANNSCVLASANGAKRAAKNAPNADGFRPVGQSRFATCDQNLVNGSASACRR